LKFLTRALVSETLHSCTKRLGDLAVMTLPGVLRSFNPALPVRGVFWN